MRTPERARRRRSAVPLGAAAAGLALAASCTSLDAHVHNLLELHRTDGSASYTGDLLSPLEFAMRQSTGPIRLHLGESAEPGAPEPIDDPYGECLDILLDLAEVDPTHVRAGGVQVEMFAWLAVDDSYSLSRERCVLELAEHARRLGVEAPMEEPEPAAGPEELERALGRIQDQAFFALRGTVAASSHATFSPEELREACDAARAMPLDREGGRRALAFCNILLGLHARASAEDRMLAAPVYELQLALQRRLVAQAIGAALEDPVSFVRAAAIEAALVLPGTDRGGLLERALTEGDRDLVVRTLRAIERHGIPRDEDDPELARKWFDRLVELAQSLDGRISAAACQALEAVTDHALVSLRAEEWKRLQLGSQEAPWR